MATRRQPGFTLIELVITLAILALLATVAMPLGQLALQRTREQELRLALRDIRGAIDAYKLAADTGHVEMKAGASGYPPDLQVLVDGVEDIKSPKASKRYFLRRLPRDPLYPDSSSEPARTWGYRSYSSEAADPRPGDDVYDVYSLSSAKGVNGVPYREW
jgi:general secretion pathway protein G